METIAPHAPNAARADARNAILASRSASIETDRSGTAGTADGQAASSLVRLDAAAIAWAQTARRISRETLERLGVGSGTAFFPGLERKAEAIFFRYAEGWKARAIEGKEFVAGKGFKLAFWNLQAMLQAKPSRVYLTEGELDACALVEAGIPVSAVLSVPNGAKERPAEDPAEQRGYDYVQEALKAGLSACREFVWCGDSDGPGRALRADMARLFGAARFRFIEWPDGAKDANDYLITDGPEALRDLVENGSLPWPVPGLYRMWELPEPPQFTLWNPGFGEWDRKIMLAPRTMSVVTGHPGHGKSVLWGQIWFQVVRAYAIPICVASFETRPKPHVRRQLRTLLTGTLEKDMSEAEIARADAWINERYLFAVHPDQRPTLDWFLDVAEVAVIRHGARIIQLDPWNRIEGSRPSGESETEYIGRCLRAIHAFAHDLNCHVQIIAHPAKMDSARKGTAPSLEDIAGSKNWENMVDQGFVVHRPELFSGAEQRTEAVLYHRKARFEELGHPCKMRLDYRKDMGRFIAAQGEEAA